MQIDHFKMLYIISSNVIVPSVARDHGGMSRDDFEADLFNDDKIGTRSGLRTGS